VYIAGRTESNLISTVEEIGAAGYFVVDVGDSDSLPAFGEIEFKNLFSSGLDETDTAPFHVSSGESNQGRSRPRLSPE